MTVNACEAEAGKDNVLHLAINSGTDLALFNALLTYVAEQGWLDRDFIAASTSGFDEALAANRTSLEEAARITGLTADRHRSRPRTGSPSPRTASGAGRCSATRRA